MQSTLGRSNPPVGSMYKGSLSYDIFDWSTEATTYFSPDLPGTYVIALRVAAGLMYGEPWTDPSFATITVTNTAPVANA